MPYAPSVARGYDGRAATTAALMCLLGQALEHTRSQNRTRRQRPRGTLKAQTHRPRRVACAVGGRMGERQAAKPHSSLVSQASCLGPEGVSRERSWAGNPAIARAHGGGRASTFFAKSGGAPSAVCFIAAVARFRTVLLWFVQRSGTQGDTVRTQHVETTARLASKTAAQRIKADICGSALPITRKEEKQ